MKFIKAPGMPPCRLPARQFSDIGINTRQGIILKLLLDEDELTQKELTGRLQLTSSSCGELIARLEQGGYPEKRTAPPTSAPSTCASPPAGAPWRGSTKRPAS